MINISQNGFYYFSWDNFSMIKIQKTTGLLAPKIPKFVRSLSTIDTFIFHACNFEIQSTAHLLCNLHHHQISLFFIKKNLRRNQNISCDFFSWPHGKDKRAPTRINIVFLSNFIQKSKLFSQRKTYYCCIHELIKNIIIDNLFKLKIECLNSNAWFHCKNKTKWCKRRF